MKCNKCKSSNVQKYQVIHEQGTSNINLGSMVSGRNPFRMHEDLVNYNLDSEDEWAEENGEDLLGADC
jgi:hypothetical protein